MDRLTTFLSRVLRDSLSHSLVRPSVRWSVHPSQSRFKGFVLLFSGLWSVEKKLGVVNSHFRCLFEKKNVCLSVCLTFFESADAGDLGLITLFEKNLELAVFSQVSSKFLYKFNVQRFNMHQKSYKTTLWQTDGQTDWHMDGLTEQQTDL